MKLTAVMSVYNGSRYLDDSIPSLFAQTSPNWKLICIDDGSTDDSLQKLQEYAAKDTRISVIHQENHGLAYARAHAFEYADTEYVAILDCDDAWSSNYVEEMLKRAEETDADAIVCDVMFGYKTEKKYDNLFHMKNINASEIIRDGRTAFSRTIPWSIHGWFCIRRELIQNYYTCKIASSTDTKGYFDEFLARMMYLRCSLIVFCKNAYYLYRMDQGSITRSLSIRRLDAMYSMGRLLKLAIEEDLDRVVIVNIYNELFITLKTATALLPKLQDSDREKAKKMISAFYKDTYRRNLKLRYLCTAKIRTIIKLLLSKISIKFIC